MWQGLLSPLTNTGEAGRSDVDVSSEEVNVSGHRAYQAGGILTVSHYTFAQSFFFLLVLSIFVLYISMVSYQAHTNVGFFNIHIFSI